MTLTYTLPARKREVLLRFIVDRNPFYLLSAVCMLTGCILLSNSSSWSPIPTARVLTLMATLNVYEALLIGLAVWLIASRRLVRDGAILLGIEAFFLVDCTFLNAEIFTVDVKLGAIVNAILFALAFAKLAVIFRGLRVRMGGAFAMILLQIAMLFALPGVFRSIAGPNRGALPATAIYAAWWAVGLLPVIGTVLLRGEPLPAYRRIVNAFLIFAFGSLALHLSLDNWVYHVRWYNANVAPMVLGLAVAVGAHDKHVVSLATRMRLQLLLPMIALGLSASFPSALMFRFGSVGGHPVWFTPLRLALLGCVLVYLHGLWLHRHVYFAVAAALCVGGAGLGYSAHMITTNLQLGWGIVVDACKRLVPRTGTHWGIVAVAASFVLLALGALTSVLKGRSAEIAREPVNPEDQLMI